MRYIDKNDFICTYHKIIQENAKKIIKILNSENKEINNDLIEEILLSVKYATNAGKRMEQRLNEYKDSIERLGFKRTKELKNKNIK